jgi:hypothetical protein
VKFERPHHIEYSNVHSVVLRRGDHSRGTSRRFGSETRNCAWTDAGSSEAAPQSSTDEEEGAGEAGPSAKGTARRRRRRSDVSSGALRSNGQAEPATLTAALATSQEPPGWNTAKRCSSCLAHQDRLSLERSTGNGRHTFWISE